MSTKTKAKKTPHTHTFQPYSADQRFGYCTCGATCYMSPRKDGELTPVRSANPMVALYGRYAGPADATCRTCVHLKRYKHHDKTYLKCDLRKLTHGSGSDHRAKWDACGKYRDLAAHVHEEIERRKATGASHWYCDICDMNVPIGHVHHDQRAPSAIAGEGR